MMTTTDLEMRVWVGCLACYNAGNLHGRWLDAAEATSWQCDNPTHEELWVFDTENMPVREEMSPTTAQAWAELVDDDAITTADDLDALRAWLDNEGTRDPEGVDLDRFRDAYRGTWETEQEYAQDYAESIGAIDENARWPNDCIDWDAATSELMQDHWSASVSGGVAVFAYV